MADQQGPWGGPAPAPVRPPPRRWGFLLWAGLICATAAAFLAMTRLFPGRFSGDDWMQAAWLLGAMSVVTMGLAAGRRRVRLREGARNLALWVVIFAVGVTAYAFGGDLAPIAARLRGALMPDYAVATSTRSMVVRRSDGDAFYVIGMVNGAPVRFLIDTGASEIVLAPEDARRAGVDVSALKFSRPSETAGGVAYGASATIAKLAVGPVTLRDVPVYVSQRSMGMSLLGMPFLRRMQSFAVNGDEMTLTGPS